MKRLRWRLMSTAILVQGGGYRDYYINIREHDSGKLYSYGLAMDTGRCFGEMLWMEDTWSADDISVSLVGLDHNGDPVELMDVTGEFMSALHRG